MCRECWYILGKSKFYHATGTGSKGPVCSLVYSGRSFLSKIHATVCAGEWEVYKWSKPYI